MCAQLVGGIAPLRVGQQVVAERWVLFHNSGEKHLIILGGDVIVQARLAQQGEVNQDLIWMMREPRATTSLNLINTAAVHDKKAGSQGQRSSRTQQLIEQLELVDNR